ncbi:hypothetical protein [Amycolatopsis thermophila]|uniref:Lipoprotein n=1 Tax=Amycolatopsis thermophila TaxID=206084 RepID=A0ABU0EXY6_9PSEU|nr:hypothetical protein [Amycolatopsis thermophila]MDQ0379720.1 hypothetical protein [Amycolatopsis thermophila]
MTAAVALTATACGESGSDSAAPATTSASSSAPPPVAEPVTPPGTSLALGQRAVVDYDDGLNKGQLAITVTSIDQADQAEFRAKFGSDAEGLTPYCTHYTVENLSGADFGTKNGPQLDALLGNGETTGTFITGGIPSCSPRMSPGDFDHPGAKYETFDLDAAAAGDTVVAVKYDGNDYSANPLIWRK